MVFGRRAGAELASAGQVGATGAGNEAVEYPGGGMWSVAWSAWSVRPVSWSVSWLWASSWAASSRSSGYVRRSRSVTRELPPDEGGRGADERRGRGVDRLGRVLLRHGV